jgi:predicted metal-dependent hydrolase
MLTGCQSLSSPVGAIPEIRPLMPLKTLILPGLPYVEVTLRRSTQARRFSLRVSRSDGRVSLSMPKWAREQAAMDFLIERQDWVRGHMARSGKRQAPRLGGTIPIEGIERPIVEGGGRAARFENGQIHVPDGTRIAPKIAALLKTLARDRLAAASDRYAAALGARYTGLSLRDTRSRWGSCTSAGALMYSWRLVMAPASVLNYVAAHEVAHLRQMNHSPQFWALCAELYPNYQVERSWLRTDGPSLLTWQFETLPQPV